MARAALGWTVREAGERAGCGANTVSRFETGTDAHASTKRVLRAAYEAANLIFIAENGEGAGVRLRKPGLDPPIG